MKRTGRILALVLALAMLFSVTVFADWTVYGGNDNHNSVVTEAPTSTSPTVKEINLLNSGSGWDGVDNVPVMSTIGSTTYAFVMYDGHAAGATLARINCNNVIAGTETSAYNLKINDSKTFQLATPLLTKGTAADGSGDAIYVASTSAAERLAALNDDAWTVSGGSKSGSNAVVPTSTTNTTVTLQQTGVDFNSDDTLRLSLGVYLGTSSAARANVKVRAYINGTKLNVINNSTSTTTAVDEVVFTTSDAPTEDTTNNTGYYHYYNVNLATTDGLTLSSNSTVKFEVEIVSVNSSVSGLKIQDPSVLRNGGSIARITNLYTTPTLDGTFQPTVNGATLKVTQQINTPITTDGTYIYYGSWSGNSAGHYYQTKISDGTTKVFTPDKYGFYWAGAVSDGTNVYFGGDNGMLYWRSIDAFDTTGGYYDLKLEESKADNVRSSIMLDDGYLYFTSQGGFVWCCLFDPGYNQLAVEWVLDIGVKSTSTPTKVGNRLYVGVYPGFNNGALFCVNTLTQEFDEVIPYNASVNNQMPIQSSIVVKGDGTGTDYLYFNTNSGSGAGVCYKFDGTTGTQVWTTDADTYALGGMAIDNGYAVFGNDYNHLYVVHDPA